MTYHFCSLTSRRISVLFFTKLGYEGYIVKPSFSQPNVYQKNKLKLTRGFVTCLTESGLS